MSTQGGSERIPNKGHGRAPVQSPAASSQGTKRASDGTGTSSQVKRPKTASSSRNAPTTTSTPKAANSAAQVTSTSYFSQGNNTQAQGSARASSSMTQATFPASTDRSTLEDVLSEYFVEDPVVASKREEFDKMTADRRPEEAKEKRDSLKRALLALRKSEHLSIDSYQGLAITPTAVVVQKDGQPLAPTPASATANLTNEQWDTIFEALGKIPVRWHVCWTELRDSLRMARRTGVPISLGSFQAAIRVAKGTHLHDLKQYLQFIMPWHIKKENDDWKDFRGMAENTKGLMCRLFGINTYGWVEVVPIEIKREKNREKDSEPRYVEEKKRVDRDWEVPAKSRVKDRGMKEDLGKVLLGGQKGLAAIESLGCETSDGKKASDDNKTSDDNSAEKESLAKLTIHQLRAVLHYFESDGTVCTEVNKVFGDFGVPLGDMSLPEEDDIRKMYEIVKNDIKDSIGNGQS